jgi:hypothetical protein
MEQNRVDQFKADIADMRLKTGGSGREQGLQALGGVLMVVGVVVGVLCYFSATNQNDARDQNELLILTLAMVGLTVVGAALFLRYSLAKFLRLWLLRQSYEAQAHIDRIIDATRR